MPSAPASAASLAIRRTRSSSTSPSIVQPNAVASPQLIARPPLPSPLAAHLHDAAEIRDQLVGAAAHVRAVVPLADREHKIHLVHPEREAPLGAARIRDQRRHGQTRQGQRVPHDFFGVGQLRQQLRRHERADLDIAHPGRVFGIEPRQFRLGRHDLGDALQAVAHPDLADRHAVVHSLGAHTMPPASHSDRS